MKESAERRDYQVALLVTNLMAACGGFTDTKQCSKTSCLGNPRLENQR